MRIEGFANTTDRDRTGDIITAQAWANGLENYQKNSVLLYQHNTSNPIGKVTNMEVSERGLWVEAEISAVNDNLHTLMNDGALKGLSVGFSLENQKYDAEKDTTFITELELLEISVVSVPANQNSLFKVVNE